MALPLLVSNLINIRYLTGVELTFGMMIINGKKRMLFVDSRYIEKAKKECEKGTDVFAIDDLEHQMRKYKRIRFEAEDVSVARLARWKKRYRGTHFLPSTEVIEAMRRAKKNAEIRSIQKACRITDRVMAKIPTLLRMKGVTEKRLAWEIEKLSKELGADAMAFNTIVGFGGHTARPHHSPTDRTLKKRDIIQIDMGVKIDGYCSDCSRVFFMGEPSAKQKDVFDLLVETVQECTKIAKVGTTNHALDRRARDSLGALESNFTHGLGHGVGLEIHEGVSLTKRAPKQGLKEHEIITIEPGIYFEGKWGMRIEDTILVGNKGSMPLTQCRKSMTGE